MAEATEISCDVAVIGAGTAGLSAARRAIAEGARVVLIDDKFAGTMCATVGCMPSKLLIAASRRAHEARGSAVFGIKIGSIEIDGPAVMRRIRKERDRFADGTRNSFDDFPPGTMIKARARFTAENRLMLDDGRVVVARAIVIATGGKPKIPDGFSGLGDLCLTHETVFELTDLPKFIAVIGSGPIGLELAQAFARLGVKTSLFDDADIVGGVKNTVVQSQIQNVLRADLDLHLGVKTQAERVGDAVQISWSGKANGSAQFDRVLIATGRPPDFKDLDLEKTGLELDEHGTPIYGRQTMQCGKAPIFIAGDANMDVPVLHEASAEGRIAGRNAATYPAVTPTQRMVPFSLIFSQPAIARVGAEPDKTTLIGKSPYDDQGRAVIEDEARGQVEIYAEPERGVLTGALLFSPGAEHLAHLLVQAISNGTTASQLLAQPFYHPTLEEGLKTALQEICSNVPSSGDYDPTHSPGG